MRGTRAPDSVRRRGGDTSQRMSTRDTRRAARRIRAKMVVLHTAFSIVLGGVLVLTLRGPVGDLVSNAEAQEARVMLGFQRADPDAARFAQSPGQAFRIGSSEDVGLSAGMASSVISASPEIVVGRDVQGRTIAAVWDAGEGRYYTVRADASKASRAALRIMALVVGVMVLVYAVIAIALELFILPRQLYFPIERLRRADAAVQRGDRERELISESVIPRDELGQIMRSRNASILKLRRQESELALALARVESIASELKMKNELLERAKRNLADQDRLASLGVMSAGLAHELNTPLSVLKGSVQQHERAIEQGDSAAAMDGKRARLMARVVSRLERLSESLLDFARAREPVRERVAVRSVVEDAWELVRLDRSSGKVQLFNEVSESMVVLGDADRLGQVFVNILRNAVDELVSRRSGGGGGRIWVRGSCEERDGARWSVFHVLDDGPGIPTHVLETLFEPFASTKLDSRGTGLGLAVAQGIVQEHHGALTARNAVIGEAGAGEQESSGAVFEIALPFDGEMTG